VPELSAGTPLITFEEALELILERIEPLPAESVPVEHAGGRILAAAAAAAVDLPPFPSSAMDGFALRAADTPGTLPVVAEVAAGRPPDNALAAGEAMAIATGAVVPDGADAVVPLEYVVRNDNTIDIRDAVAAGANVRPRGGDARAGEIVIESGTVLGAAQLGALGAAGVADVRCARQPRAAVLTTGSELRAPGVRLAPGEIYEANGPTLAAALATAGAEVERLPPVPDDEQEHRKALARGLETDVLVTSGGVSVGPHDLVRRVEAELGVEEVFWRVAVKPGKPISFGTRGPTLVFGLPGNPVSVLVAAYIFVRPALLALQGAREPRPRFLPGRLVSAVGLNPARDEFVRARLRPGEDVMLVEPTTGQESHMIVRAAGATALAFVPRGEGQLAAGSPVRYIAL
jgi:molybdopterin molybdotransferase